MPVTKPRPRHVPRWLSALLVASSLELGASGCISYGPPAPTSVARGEYFSTQNPDYDDFFLRLFRLQVELGQAPEKLTRTRTALNQRLGIPANAEAPAIKTALGERASTLRAHGLSVRVEPSRDTPGEVVLRVSGSRNATDAELLTALEQALGDVNQLRQALPGWHKQLEELPPRGVALESGIETAFVGRGRGERTEIRDNLADAQKIMGLMGPRLKALEQAGSDLVEAMTAAFPAPAPTPAPEPAPPESEPKPKARATRPGARSPAPKSAAKPAPATERSEAPPPKPAQGTAKPDFEP